jgi:hypothetical protein
MLFNVLSLASRIRKRFWYGILRSVSTPNRLEFQIIPVVLDDSL